jgi:hypothetical protein
MEHLQKARIYRIRWERLQKVEPRTIRVQKIMDEIEVRGLTFCLFEIIMQQRLN